VHSPFEWNPDKAEANGKKHGIRFEEARTVFADSQLITFLDEEHSTDEDRYITIGISEQNRLLMIAHTERNGHIRIISARKATNHERNFYATS